MPDTEGKLKPQRQRVITQLLTRGMGVRGCFTTSLTSAKIVIDGKTSQMVDGPRTLAGIWKALVGRVVGVLQSIAIERTVGGSE